MKVSITSMRDAKAEAFVVGVVSKGDQREAPSLKAIGEEGHRHVTRLLATETAGLGPKQVVSLPAENRDATVVLVGLGDPANLTQEKLGACLNAALKHAKGLGARTVATTLATDAAGDKGLDDGSIVQALVHGAILGDLQFDQYKSKKEDKGGKGKEKGKEKPKPAIDEVQIIHPRPAGARRRAEAAAITAEAVNDARLLANTPANIATPEWMAEQARQRGKQHGFKVTVKGREQLRKEGYNALCGVAQGSANEERLIVMDHNPPNAKKTLVIVGKGVCFDSGGISLKPGQGMWDMKYDKCGACNVIALMGAVARLGVKHRVIGITPCVENMPSGTAQRPGDIVTAKDGTTIEVLNTDAEGRLILADAITLGTTYEPAWMVDMATLTGACEYAVGTTYVAVMSKDEAFMRSLIEASARAGDKAWPLPQGEEFDEANKGTYADIQNISLTSKAGTSIGGSFVAHFAKDTRFAHLDIASKAWTSGVDYFAKGPTGAGLRIVLERILSER